MDDSLRSFQKREAALRRKHMRMAQGYVTKLDKTGLIIQQPDSKMGGTAWRLLLRSTVLFMAFKVLVLAALGTETYAGHLEPLAQGSVHEKAGAWLMQIDPVTAMLAQALAPLLS